MVAGVVGVAVGVEVYVFFTCFLKFVHLILVMEK